MLSITIILNMKANKIKTKLKGYFDMIRPYLGDVIDNYKTQEEWKIQWKMLISCISSKDSDEIRTMHTRNDKIIEKPLESLLKIFTKKNENKWICF